MIFLHALIVFSGFTRLLYLRKEASLDITLCQPFTYNKIAQLLEKGTRPLCYQDKLEKFSANGSNFMLESELTQFFQSTCYEPDLKIRCYEDAVVGSKRCLNEKEKEMLKALESIDDQLTSYICKNKELITKYFGELNKSCLTGLTDVIEKCLMLNNTERIFKDISTITTSQFEESEACMTNIIFKQCSENERDVISTAIKILKHNMVNMTSTNNMQLKPKSLHRIVRDLAMSEKMQRMEIHVKTACVKNGEPTKKLEDTLEKMKSCINEKPMFLVPKHVFIKHLDDCTKDAITLFKSCLPEQYKYLPKLMFDIIDSVVSFLYDDFTLVSSELTPCLPKLREEKSTKEYNECVEKIVSNTEDELVDSKIKFCERFIPLNQCFITQVHKQCQNSTGLTKFENDFMNAVKKPCETK